MYYVIEFSKILFIIIGIAAGIFALEMNLSFLVCILPMFRATKKLEARLKWHIIKWQIQGSYRGRQFTIDVRSNFAISRHPRFRYDYKVFHKFPFEAMISRIPSNTSSNWKDDYRVKSTNLSKVYTYLQNDDARRSLEQLFLSCNDNEVKIHYDFVEIFKYADLFDWQCQPLDEAIVRDILMKLEVFAVSMA